MPTKALSQMYDLFQLDQVMDTIRECLAQLEITETTTHKIGNLRCVV